MGGGVGRLCSANVSGLVRIHKPTSSVFSFFGHLAQTLMYNTPLTERVDIAKMLTVKYLEVVQLRV